LGDERLGYGLVGKVVEGRPDGLVAGLVAGLVGDVIVEEGRPDGSTVLGVEVFGVISELFRAKLCGITNPLIPNIAITDVKILFLSIIYSF